MISTTTTTITATPAAGSNVAVAFPYRFDEEEHLDVYRVTTAGVRSTLVEGVDYSVAGTGNSAGGTLTITTVTSGDTIVIAREVDITQQQDYVNNDTFPAAGHEGQLDKQIQIDQQLNSGLGRTIKVLKGEPNPVVSARADRKTSFPIWDANGDYTEWTPAQVLSTLPIPPGTVSNQGTASWADDAARATEVPAAVGQIGTQVDTLETFVATGITAGDWRYIGRETYPVTTFAELETAITAIAALVAADADAYATILILRPITLTSKVTIPDAITLKFDEKGYFDFGDTVDLLQIDGNVEAGKGQHIFRNTKSGTVISTPDSTAAATVPSVYGQFNRRSRFASWWLGKSGQGPSVLSSAEHLQAALDSGWSPSPSFKQSVHLIVDGYFHFSALEVTMSDRRVCLESETGFYHLAGFVVTDAANMVDSAGGNTPYMITMANSGTGNFEKIRGIGLKFTTNSNDQAVGCIRAVGTTLDHGLQEGTEVTNCNFSGYSEYGFWVGNISGGVGPVMNGFTMSNCDFINSTSADSVAIYLDGSAAGGATRSSPHSCSFEDITVNPYVGTHSRCKRGIVNRRGGQITFSNIHAEECSIGIDIENTVASIVGTTIIDQFNVNNDGYWTSQVMGSHQDGSNFADTETVTLDDGINATKVYTMQTSLTNVDGNVLIGATLRQSYDNLAAAINLGAGAGSTYATATTAPPLGIDSAVSYPYGANLEILGKPLAGTPLVATVVAVTTSSAAPQIYTTGTMQRLVNVDVNSTAGSLVMARSLHGRMTSSVLSGARIFDAAVGCSQFAGDTSNMVARFDSGVLNATVINNTGLQQEYSVPDAATVAKVTTYTGSYNDVVLPNIGPNATYLVTPGGNLSWTGLDASPVNGRYEIINKSITYTITLKDNDGASVAGLRFRCPGAVDYVIPVNGSCVVRRDATLGAWVIVP